VSNASNGNVTMTRSTDGRPLSRHKRKTRDAVSADSRASSRQDVRQRPRTVRIGAVSYLNSKPLIHGLTELAPQAELVLDYPSRLADELAQGRLDVALIPSIECFREPDYEIVSDACVATHGPVLSVKLYSRVPLSEIRTLALDEGSRTSAALVQIMLHERFGVEPTVKELPLGSSFTEPDADAVLLIGDRAMAAAPQRLEAVWDLGEEWLNWTGLPFVFAMWVANGQSDVAGIAEALGAARDSGLANLEKIARREAPALGLSENVAVEYLARNLYYRLGDAERSGLRLFHELAMKLGLAPEGVELVFQDSHPAGQSRRR